MTTQERLSTADDLWEMQKQDENDGKFLELIDGVIAAMAPASATPAMYGARLTRIISTFVDDNDLGWVTNAEGGYELSPNNVLAPDVGFVSKIRQPELPERYFKLPPDLAVEVVSPTDSVKAVLRKARKYLAYGTKMVVIWYPSDKTVDVCLPSDDGMIIREIDIDGEVDFGDALPGLTIKVKDVFK